MTGRKEGRKGRRCRRKVGTGRLRRAVLHADIVSTHRSTPAAEGSLCCSGGAMEMVRDGRYILRSAVSSTARVAAAGRYAASLLTDAIRSRRPYPCRHPCLQQKNTTRWSRLGGSARTRCTACR